MTIPDWHYDEAGRVVAVRRAEFWHMARNRKGKPAVACDLCYRRCVLNRDERGWCGYRKNVDHRMTLTAHGVISCAVRVLAGYGVDPFLTHKPGQTTLFLGLTHCTAGCTFCMSTDITWRPRELPWVGNKEGGIAYSSGQYAARSYLHPAGAIALAKQWGCQRILFGINEPTMSYEYVLDTAQLARRAGLDVALETNGFCGRTVVERLAPNMTAVDVGVKGSADPAFYDRWMKSPGAVPTVLESARAWKDAGVFVLVGDLIAPPQMQDDATFTDAAQRFYAWVADTLGPLTPLLITAIERPGPMREGRREGGANWLLSARQGKAAIAAYELRQQRALALAHAAGLAYAHRKRKVETFTCHACGGVLLQIRSLCESAWDVHPDATHEPCASGDGTPVYCPFWSHEQHVTAGQCDHCGARVPVVVLTADERAAAHAVVQQNAGHLLTGGIQAEAPLVSADGGTVV